MFVNSVALHRLLQTITWQGSVHTFLRQGKNDYGEKAEKQQEIAQINGLFHNGSSQHIAITTADSGMVINKNTPYIMTAWGNAEKLQLEDQVIINGDTFKVTGLTNIGEYNIIGEVSLERVL